MGGGKTEGMIHDLNMRHKADPSFKVIVLLVKRTEAFRIHDGCPELNFAVPERKSGDYRSVAMQTEQFLLEGRNIASTHAAFLYYTETIRDLIKQNGYSLYIDEAMDAVTQEKYKQSDIDLLKGQGLLVKHPEHDYYIATKEALEWYSGEHYSNLLRAAFSRGLADVVSSDNKEVATYFFWIIPSEMLLCFKDVTILTFNFEIQPMAFYLKMNELDYRMIGVGVSPVVGFYFTSNHEEYYYPHYLTNIKELVHVVETPKMKKRNYYGRNKYAMSMNWYKNPDNVATVGKDLDSFYRKVALNLTDDNGANRRMWSTYKEKIRDLVGKYRKLSLSSEIPYNARAFNDMSDRTILAYPVSLYINGGVKTFWSRLGYNMSDDMYALNCMIQWIWRSAIRNGKEIWVLVPSNRMRELLKNWLDDPLQYCQIS